MIEEGIVSGAGIEMWSVSFGYGERRRLFGRQPVKSALTLSEISLQIDRGELFGLVGPNGSGKTTLAKLLLGVLEPSAGAILVDGKARPHLRNMAWRSCLGFVSGALSKLFNSMDLEEHIAFYRSLYSLFDRDRLRSMLEAAQLSDKLAQYPSTLSFGERVKFELALTLATRPRILVLDEPTVGLDPIAIAQVRQSVKSYVEESGAAGILTSHNLADIEAICPHGAFLERGRLTHPFRKGEIDAIGLERRYLEVFREAQR